MRSRLARVANGGCDMVGRFRDGDGPKGNDRRGETVGRAASESAVARSAARDSADERAPGRRRLTRGALRAVSLAALRATAPRGSPLDIESPASESAVARSAARDSADERAPGRNLLTRGRRSGRIPRGASGYGTSRPAA